MAAAATEDDEIIPQKGSHVASVIWKWFRFARSDMEQHDKPVQAPETQCG